MDNNNTDKWRRHSVGMSVLNGRNGTVDRSPRVQRTLSSSPSVDREVRLAMMGSSGVGKTALVVRYLTRRFIGDYAHYESVCTCNTTVECKPTKLHILDTTGEEDDPQLRRSQLQYGEGTMLVFSLTDRNSFLYVVKLVEDILAVKDNGKPLSVILVGNKCDLAHLRKVSEAEIRQVSSALACQYVETSASESYASVVNAFLCLVQDVRNNQKREKVRKLVKKAAGSRISHLCETLRNFRSRTNTF